MATKFFALLETCACFIYKANYGGPKGRAMRQLTCANNYVTVDDYHVTVDDIDVMIDRNYVMIGDMYVSMWM